MLKTRIQQAFGITDAITFTLPPNGPVFDRPGLIGDCVVHDTNVPCAHLTRNTYMGVHLGTPLHVRRERTPRATGPITGYDDPPVIPTQSSLPRPVLTRTPFPAPSSAYTLCTTTVPHDETIHPSIPAASSSRLPFGHLPRRMHSRY
jgi:hypothetical protein